MSKCSLSIDKDIGTLRASASELFLDSVALY